MSKRETIFSPCRKYRYTLWREFYGVHALPGMDVPIEGNKALHYVQFIGLNPSTADETKDDPTIRRCIGFAKSWGYGAMCMTNLFAFRATDPKVMKAQEYPVGEFSFCAYGVGDVSYASRNSAYIHSIASGAAITVAAWGKDGSHLKQGDEIKTLFLHRRLKLHHLGLNGDGTPKHPLYLKKTLTPILWQ